MDVSVWVALAAAALALVALAGCAALWARVRRLRAAQEVLLPDGASAGLVDRQATLQRSQDRLERGLADLESMVERQGEITERGLRSALRFQGLVRYDAYRDMGGQQSWSIALIDGERNGAVVTSLHARDHARVYMKEIVEGVPGQRLSPEEERAVALALGGPMPEGAASPAEPGPVGDDGFAAEGLVSRSEPIPPPDDDDEGPPTGEMRRPTGPGA